MRRGLTGFIISLLVFITGCLEGPPPAATDLRRTLTPNQAEAERLALKGEALLTPVSFVHANDLFNQALSFDPENLRAGLYQALLAPAMKTRGLLTRIAPYVEGLPDRMRQNYERNVSEIKQAGMRDFLMSGTTEDLKTEADVQNFLHELTSTLGTARAYIKANKMREMELTANHHANYNDPNCHVHSSGGNYEILGCGTASLHTYKLSLPDFEYFQQVVAGYQIFGTVISAYDTTGANELVHYLEGTSNSTEYSVIEFLKGISRFGTLRANHRLGEIIAMGSDLVAGLRWAKSLKRSQCPNGVPSHRPGHVVDRGICIRETTEDGRSVDRLLDIADLAFQSATVEFSFAKPDGGMFVTQVQPYRMFVQPILDLKKLAPTSFSSCGRSENFGDETLGGVFPRVDASRALLANRSTQCP